MYFDSPDAKHFSSPIMSEHEFEQRLESIADCTLLMNIINDKQYKTEEDEQQWLLLKAKAESLLQSVNIYMEEHMEKVFGMATEMFRRAKEGATAGDPDGLKAWEVLKPLKEQMLQLQIRQRGVN